jgi:hypothetical protein
MVEESEEGGVGCLAKIRAGSGDGFGWTGVEGLPTAGTFKVGKGYARGDTERPRAKDGGLTQKRELTKDLNRGLLEDVVGEAGTGQAGDVAAQLRIAITKKLFQGSPVACLGEENEEGLVVGRGLLRIGRGVHT